MDPPSFVTPCVVVGLMWSHDHIGVRSDPLFITMPLMVMMTVGPELVTMGRNHTYKSCIRPVHINMYNVYMMLV